VKDQTDGERHVDIRYVVTSLDGAANYLYEDVYCQRGRMENLIKLHKAQLASDRMSCHSATANQVRLVLHFGGRRSGISSRPAASNRYVQEQVAGVQVRSHALSTTCRASSSLQHLAHESL
jgi:hypothetical protein